MTPCNCRNPVHERCLFQWITNRRQGRSQCEICREPWRNDALMRGEPGHLPLGLAGAASWLAALPCGMPKQLPKPLHARRKPALLRSCILKPRAALPAVGWYCGTTPLYVPQPHPVCVQYAFQTLLARCSRRSRRSRGAWWPCSEW